MKITDKELQRRQGKKTVVLSIRINPKTSKWLKDQNLSPTGIFYKALEELGCKA